MGFKNVVVIGGGVLGSQIAYQTAYKGFNVTCYLRSEASIARAKPKFETLHKTYLATLDKMATPAGKSPYLFCRGLADQKTFKDEMVTQLKQNADDAFNNMKYETNLAEAVKDADLVIESLAEDKQQKIDFYKELAKYLPEKTVVVTNTSTLLPSSFAPYTGRPEKFLALHFANTIWRNNTAEVMVHAGTDPKYSDQLMEFAAQIGMVPLKLNKEQPGYILNTMLIPFLSAAEGLMANEVSDPKTIDLTWCLATGAPAGPFKILDIIGLTTAYNISIMEPGSDDPNTTAGRVAKMLKEYIDAGKTGVASGEGFYKYN